MLAPTFEKLAESYGHAVTFAKVNVDEVPEIAEKYAIRSIPTLLLLREGQVVERLVGVRSQQELARVLDQHAGVSAKLP
jgi:thioredoxin 1